MKVLFACPWIPWPLENGGKIRTYHLLRQAARHAEVHLRCIVEPGRSADEARELESFCGSVRVFERERPDSWTRWSRPKLERWFHSPAMRAHVRSELEQPGWDVVHLDELLLTRLPAIRTQAAVVQHHHKLDSILYSRLTHEPGVTERFDLWKLSRLERESSRLWRHHIVCSEGDREILLQRYPKLDVVAVPSGFDPAHFLPSKPVAESAGQRVPGRLLFLGSMSYGPNVDAVQRFVESVLPVLREKYPKLHLQIVGVDPTPAVRALAGEHVEVTGAVPDVRPYLESAALLVVPLRIGGGTRLKIVEALALGTPVVSTEIGAEGLALKHGEHLLLAKDSAEFAESVGALLDEPVRARAMAEAGRRQVARLYTWEILGERLVAAWREAAASER